MVYNRIPVTFGAVRRITGPTISYQYDVKQILVISGIELPEYYVVDFCNEGDATVIPMTGTSDGVEIPDSLLQTGKPVKAYIVVSGGQGDVQTRYEVKLPVNNRPMREDVHPTDPQQQQIDALVAALNSGVDRAESAATEAEEASGHYPTIVDAYWYLWDVDAGAYVPTGIKAEGTDGVSPTVTVSEITGGHRITITDRDGTRTVDVMDGENGKDGKDGSDGFSPTITVADITGGHRVTITDKNGTRTVDVMDGTDGKDGKDGSDGDDGYSPAVTITEITDGHRVTITDKDHPQGQSFDVMDGQDGASDAGEVTFDPTQTYQSGTVGKALTDQKNAISELVVSSPNLYNVAENTDGMYIASNGAEKTDVATRSTTDYIYLPAGSYWVSRDTGSVWGFMYIAYYDESKVFVNRPQLTDNVITVNSPCYVRLWGTTTHIANAMVVAGTTAPESYIPYYEEFNDELIPEKYKTGDIEWSRIKNVSASMTDTDFVSISEQNLINRMTVEEGKAISAYGEITTNGNYAITDKLYFDPSTLYSYRNCVRIVYFDATDTRVGSDQLSERGAGYDTGTFTTKPSFEYAIVMLPMSTVYKKEWQIVKGDTLPDYEPQHLIIDGYRVYDDPAADIDPIEAIKKWDKIVTDPAPIYLRDTDASALTANDRNVSAIYSYYDALMATNPEYITKTALGDDGNGVTLYKYEFKTPEYSSGTAGQTVSNKRKTKMILVSGVHPEFAGIYSLYHAMERITNDPKLEDIKSQMHFVIMPVVNAYACNGNAARKNHNGIDLARNFEVDFAPGTDPSTETYAGTEPLSEVEDQYVDQIMADNTDAIYFASCHNFQRAEVGGVTMPNFNMWGCAASMYWSNLAAKVIDKLTTAWKEKYSYTDLSFGSTEIAAPQGSEGKQALKYGIQGGTFEVSAFFNAAEPDVAYSASAISRGSEVYVNMIRTAMYCFNYRDKVHQLEA